MANSPLQQSSFVFFPEEERLRRNIAANPEGFRAAAGKLLAEQNEAIAGREARLRVYAATCAEIADGVGKRMETFAQTLPQSLFGSGDGGAFILPLGMLFEWLNERKTALGNVLLAISTFWEEERFQTHRVETVAAVLGDEALMGEVAAAQNRQAAFFARAETLSARVAEFSEAVIGAFFTGAAEAADLDRNGRQMRFGAIAKLCGEARHAAETFSAQCRKFHSIP